MFGCETGPQGQKNLGNEGRRNDEDQGKKCGLIASYSSEGGGKSEPREMDQDTLL